jgi:hypothetical protein
MFDDIQTMQLFDRFHEKLHEVSSSSKLESCLRVQKLGTQPHGHNIFKAAHISNLKNVLSTAFSTHFILVPVWGLKTFSPNWYQYETRRKCCRQDIFYHGTSHQDSCGTRKAFSCLPTRYVQCLLDHYNVYIAKRLVVFAPKITEKSPFLNAQLVQHFFCVIFPTNKYNNGHPYLRQWLLLVLVPMMVYIAKILIILVPKSAEKSPFLNVRAASIEVAFPRIKMT